MAVHPLVLKALIAAPKNKKFFTIIAVILTTLLMPIILVVVILVYVTSGATDASNALRDCCFKDAPVPPYFTNEQVRAIWSMKADLKEIEEVIAGKVEEDDSVLYDENMVKAVFYCLQFGFRKDDFIIPDIDIGEFVEYFEDKTMDDLLVILNEIAADYEVYKITGNTGVAVREIYNYLNE